MNQGNRVAKKRQCQLRLVLQKRFKHSWKLKRRVSKAVQKQRQGKDKRDTSIQAILEMGFCGHQRQRTRPTNIVRRSLKGELVRFIVPSRNKGHMRRRNRFYISGSGVTQYFT